MSLFLFLRTHTSVAAGPVPELALAIELTPGQWADLTADVAGKAGIRIRYGIAGHGPTDRVASTGTLEFSLKNGLTSSGGVLGYYSPGHANCRPGFGFGKRVRVQLKGGSESEPVAVTKFLGRLTTIEPAPGQYRERRTRCLATDWMDLAAQIDIRDIAPQESKTADDLILALLAAMPPDSECPGMRPEAVDLDRGSSIFPYTFANLGGGPVYALSLLNDIVQSDLGYLTVQGGTLRYENRTARDATVSQLTLDNTMSELSVPSSLDDVYNRVRVTIHPRTVDASPIVLCALTGTATLAAFETAEFWMDYRDPDNAALYVGGKDFVAPVATTDYVANSEADGSGTDLTGLLTVTAYGFASSVKFTVTNGAAVPAYLTTLQYRGIGIHDLAPRTYEAYTPQPYGERRIDIDLPYLSVELDAQTVADDVVARYASPAHAAGSLTFPAGVFAWTNARYTAMRDREPGDRITLSETMTGLLSVDAIIQSVDLEIGVGPQIRCTWGLAPIEKAA